MDKAQLLVPMVVEQTGRGERGYDHRHKDSNGRPGKDHQIAAERIQRSTVESEVGIEHAEWFSIEKQAGMARGANFTRLHPGQPKVVHPVIDKAFSGEQRRGADHEQDSQREQQIHSARQLCGQPGRRPLRRHRLS